MERNGATSPIDCIKHYGIEFHPPRIVMFFPIFFGFIPFLYVKIATTFYKIVAAFTVTQIELVYL